MRGSREISLVSSLHALIGGRRVIEVGLCVCACACVWVCVRVRACVRAYVCPSVRPSVASNVDMLRSRRPKPENKTMERRDPGWQEKRTASVH